MAFLKDELVQVIALPWAHGVLDRVMQHREREPHGDIEDSGYNGVRGPNERKIERVCIPIIATLLFLCIPRQTVAATHFPQKSLWNIFQS